MNKSELIDQIAKSADLSKAASNKINCKLCNTDMKIISYGDGKYRKE